MPLHINRTRASRCPHCNNPLTAATHFDGRPHKPSPGDWSVCLECGGLLRFNIHMRTVAGRAIDLADEPPELRDVITRMQQHIRGRNA